MRSPLQGLVVAIESLECRRLLAATYYVGASGNDAWAGTTPQTAWRTIARVNSKDFNAGDKVLFEGGKTFSAAGAKGPELLTNPGFESGFTGWSDTLGTFPARTAIVTG